MALVGPTASGKSALALAAAAEWPDIELVSMDSMQVYRGMDIGTAKPSAAEQAAVRHHLIDIADPSEDFSVVRFQGAARAAIREIESRGRRALLVGGTGLYLQAVIDDLRFPGEDLELRARIDARCEDPTGLEVAYAELAERDPVAAGRIEPGNRRRIVRALEVIELTGQPFSSFGAGIGGSHPSVVDVRIAGLRLDAPTIATRVEDRVAAMLAAGLVEEVRGLAARPDGWSRTARQAIGYKELLKHLDGEASLEEATEQILIRSRNFARRQRAWYRRDGRVHWFDVEEKRPSLAAEVMAWWCP
ncbi:MAG: tRNA (adenosine(37)-N6)-dimethylallyltransferase MiaA [Acidimicrobiia bacterium]|nr:tRNA (adenosine(37)-N6)-dimethylallyltransferase MiaA [Acidimicrobiia bacterium]